MPGCAAVGCNNRSEKGYIMKCFPRDPKLRKIWQDRVARADWEPSNNSFLCHVHFEPEEWSMTSNGSIRLKKNAIPSIFTVTSTRKSAKKRTKVSNKNENECDNDYMTEFLENDTEHSLIVEEKDSDSQDAYNSTVQSFVYQEANNSPVKMENKSYGQYIDVTNDLQEENIIIILDDNKETENNTKENNAEGQANMENTKSINNFITKKNLSQNQNEEVVIKTEIKRDINQMLDDSYDEIEEKLKQICDDHREENDVTIIEELNSNSRNRRKTSEKSITQIPFHKSINYKYSSRNEIGDILMDNRDNIEIIFGSESGEEVSRVPRCTFYNSETNDDKLNVDKLDQYTTNIDRITNNKEINEVFEYQQEAFDRENIYIGSNLRIREEVMKSIKKPVQNVSIQDSVSNTDISDITEVENEIRKNISEITQNKDDNKDDTTKFTLKVTGDRQDVFEIMQDLFQDTKDFIIQEHSDTCSQQEDNAPITSIVTINHCPIERDFIDTCKNDIFWSSVTNAARDDDQESFTLKHEDYLTSRSLSLQMDEEKDLDITNAIVDVNKQTLTNVYNKYDCEKLQQKVKWQETVIKRLTNQFILLKDLEKKQQNKNLMLRTKIKKLEKQLNELNKYPGTPSSMNYKQTDLKQRLIYDLSNRMNNLEEANKKLMKTITIECQQKRRLESQIKQRDKQIKELNWKLEKASKYLERAEKNTNTYKRKMLNMQTFMRRKKLLDGNTSKFHEIMIDNMKEDYSEKVLTMVTEIKEACGANGYKTLLNYGFPLPALSLLEDVPSDSISDCNKNNGTQQVVLLKQNTNEGCNPQPMENDTKVNARYYYADNSTSLHEEIMMETVTGTVQDIFDESNDDIDDFSTNELKKHFMQLNAVM